MAREHNFKLLGNKVVCLSEFLTKFRHTLFRIFSIVMIILYIYAGNFQLKCKPKHQLKPIITFFRDVTDMACFLKDNLNSSNFCPEIYSLKLSQVLNATTQKIFLGLKGIILALIKIQNVRVNEKTESWLNIILFNISKGTDCLSSSGSYKLWLSETGTSLLNK